MVRPCAALGLLAALLSAPALVACSTEPQASVVGRSSQDVRLAGPARVEAWFTTPTPGSTAAPALEDALVALLQSASTSIDIAAYDFDRPAIIDAVLAAHAQGVAVRFVGDGDQVGEAGYAALAAAGVPMSLRPAGSAIMHDKFVVVDGVSVFTGSTNLSDNDLLVNDNDSLVIEDPALAAAYTAELDEMFTYGRFGRSKLDVTAGNVVTASGVNVEYFFGPRDGLMARVLERVDTAQSSVHAMVFTFTRTDLRDRLIARQTAGAGVYAIFDSLQASAPYAQDEALAAAGVPTWLDGNTSGLLHHKVMVIDGDAPGSDPMVITGSFNWTAAADQDNDENLLVVHSPELARAYLRRFCALHAKATRHPSYTGASTAGCVGRAVVNEALPNPAGTDLGQEYVEIANAGFAPLDLGGFTVRTAGKVRHTFPSRFFLPPGGVSVVYDRGVHDVPGAVLSTTGTLALTNTSGSVALHDSAGALADTLAWSATRSGVAKNRSVDVTFGASVVDHDKVPLVSGGATLLSPGTHADGMAFEGVGAVVPARAPAAGELVVTQLATRGAASASDEFVELYNPTHDLLAIGGVRLQYQPASCSGWSDRHVVPPGVELKPGQFYLVTGSAYVVPASGPAGEGTLTSGIADSGLLRLVGGSTTLDTAAYGTGLSCLGEGGSAAPNHGTTANGKSVARRPYSSGAPFSLTSPVQDTDVNSADFAVRTARAPRNGAVVTPSH